MHQLQTAKVVTSGTQGAQLLQSSRVMLSGLAGSRALTIWSTQKENQGEGPEEDLIDRLVQVFGVRGNSRAAARALVEVWP